MGTDKNVVMLAADTVRTSAYAQALADAGLKISSIGLIIPDTPKWGQASLPEKCHVNLDGLFLPDVTVPAISACQSLCNHVDVLHTNSINDPDCIDWLRKQSAELVIFSGFGGELVKNSILDIGVPLLHIHAGWLPDYRGSTTIYYSLLKEGTVGVSAIILTESIDAGPIVARKTYPPPPAGIDLDYCYDSAVRADLLVRVISDFYDNGEMQRLPVETDSTGRDYYIIHPLLKHIVLRRFS